MEHTHHMDHMDMGKDMTEHEKITPHDLKEIGTIHLEGVDFPNYIGHATPGMIFIIFGLRFTYCTFYRHFLCLKESQSGRKQVRSYENSFFFGWSRFPGVPVDSIIGVVGSLAGLFVELLHYNPVGYALHNLLYLSFGIACVIDVISKYNSMVPKNMEYYSFVIALWANSMLLYTHSRHHGPLDAMIHTRLLIIVMVAVVFILLEAHQSHNVLPAIGRSFCCIFLGCWWCTIAEVMYPITHAITLTDNHRSLMTLEIIFVMEMLSLVCVSVVVAVIANFRVKRMSFSRVSSALDDEFLLVKRKSTIGPSKKSTDFGDGSNQPLISGDSDSASCC